MVWEITTVDHVVYSDEYLDSIRSRFPEYKEKTDEQLLLLLTQNDDREEWVYENEYEAARKQVESEVTFRDQEEDWLLNTIFEESENTIFTKEEQDKIRLWLFGLVQKKRDGTIILWSYDDEDNKWDSWFNEVIWPLAPGSSFNFHHYWDNNTENTYLKRGEKSKKLVVLLAKSEWFDTLKRPKYAISTKLIHIPWINISMYDGFVNHKELNLNEFQGHLQKCTARF